MAAVWDCGLDCEFVNGLGGAKPDLFVIVWKIDRSNSGLLDHSIDRSCECSIIQTIARSIQRSIVRTIDSNERPIDHSNGPNQTPAFTNTKLFKNFVLLNVGGVLL